MRKMILWLMIVGVVFTLVGPAWSAGFPFEVKDRKKTITLFAPQIVEQTERSLIVALDAVVVESGFFGKDVWRGKVMLSGIRGYDFGTTDIPLLQAKVTSVELEGMDEERQRDIASLVGSQLVNYFVVPAPAEVDLQE